MIAPIIPLNNLLFSRDPASSGKRQITQIKTASESICVIPACHLPDGSQGRQVFLKSVQSIQVLFFKQSIIISFFLN
jgi:hypothetical protein